MRRNRDRVIACPFPLSADLPDEFDDLLATWTELKDAAMPVAVAILDGKSASIPTFPSLARANRRLAALREEQPDIAGEYVASFRAIEDLVEAIQEAVRDLSPKG